MRSTIRIDKTSSRIVSTTDKVDDKFHTDSWVWKDFVGMVGSVRTHAVTADEDEAIANHIRVVQAFEDA